MAVKGLCWTLGTGQAGPGSSVWRGPKGEALPGRPQELNAARSGMEFLAAGLERAASGWGNPVDGPAPQLEANRPGWRGCWAGAALQR
jgi:hypothetical protein